MGTSLSAFVVTDICVGRRSAGQSQPKDVSTLWHDKAKIASHFHTGGARMPRWAEGKLTAEIPLGSAGIFEIH